MSISPELQEQLSKSAATLEDYVDEMRKARDSKPASPNYVTKPATDPELKSFFLDRNTPLREYNISGGNRYIVPGTKANEITTATTGGAATGGFLYENALYPEIIKPLLLASPILANATKLVTDHLRPVDIPSLVTDATAAQHAETIAATQSFPVEARLTLTAWRQDLFLLVSEEVLRTCEYDIEAYLGTVLSRALGVKMASALAIGVGATAPTGLTVAVTVGKTTAASPTAVTLADLFDLYFSVPVQWRNTGCWIISDGLAKQMALYVSGGGDYLMGGLQTGPDGWRLMGRPVYIDSNMPDPASGTVTAVFGDVSQYVVRLSNIVVKKAEQPYITQFLTAYVGGIWIDAGLPSGSAGALRSLKMHA